MGNDVGTGDGQGEKSQREVKMVVMSASSVPMVFPAVLMILWMASCSSFCAAKEPGSNTRSTQAETDQQSLW